MTHTCCQIETVFDDREDGLNIKPKLPRDDIEDIREEERDFLDQIEKMLDNPDSEWCDSLSALDILLEISDTRPPPTLRWANFWSVRYIYGLDEVGCEEVRITSRISPEEFWESKWVFPDTWPAQDAAELLNIISKIRRKTELPRAYRCHHSFKMPKCWIEFRP